MKVLLVGANGQLGRCLKDRFPPEWAVLATDSAMLDITDYNAVINTVDIFQPNVIINAAAYTAVDKAEEECELAHKVNVEGPHNLAQAAKKFNAQLVHISTDYVFDGNGTKPYKEDDLTNPLGTYGITKLKGEQLVLEVIPSALIIRTAWVFSEYGKNFVKTMVNIACNRSDLKVVADQRGCPTYAGDIAQAILDILKTEYIGGIYHYCGDEEVSWCDFAIAIFEKAKSVDLIPLIPVVRPISSNEYPTLAVRPKYSTLSCDKVDKLGVEPSHWRSSLLYVLQRWVNEPAIRI